MRPVSLAAALGLAFFACPAALAQQNRFEPNNTRRTAARVEPGDYKDLYCNEDDWYFLEVSPGQRLEVSARFDEVEGDLELELRDSRGRLRGWSRGTGSEEVLSFVPSERMPVFLRVYNGAAAYDLHVGLAESEFHFDGVEGMASGTNCWGSDWYAVEVTAGEALRVEASFQHAEGDLDLALHNTDGDELAASTGQDDGESLSYMSDEDTLLLVHVFHVHRSRSDYDLRVSVGAAVPDDMAQVFRTDRPQGAGNDYLELINGDVLRGRVLNDSVRMATSYADVVLPLARVAGVELSRGRGEIQTLMTVTGDRFSGFCRTPIIRFQPEDFDEPLEIPQDYVTLLVFGMRGNERAGRERLPHFVLGNGDHFDGHLLTSDWVLDLGFTTRPLDLSAIQELSLLEDRHVSVQRVDGATLSGHVDVEMLQVALVDAPDAPFGIHRDRVQTIFPLGTSEEIRGGRRLRFDFADSVDPWVAQDTPGSHWIHWPRDGVDGDGCLRLGGPNGAQYANSANSTCTSPALYVGRLDNPTLNMQVKTRLEQGCDHFIIRVSYDGGTSYETLHQMTGQMEWAPVSLPLRPGAEEVVIQFNFTSDGSVVNEGIWVDEVEITDRD